MADNTDDLIISISTDQATLRRSIKRIEQDLSGLAGSVQRQFATVGKSIDNSVTSSMQNRINAMVGIGTKASKEWTGALADQGKELERLRARYSPLFATINSYKAAVSDIKRAHSIGAISANEMAAAISKERQAALASTAAIKGRNAALADTPSQRAGGSGYTSNIAAQFQDIGVTAAMGMSPLQVALQQGTQLSAVFNDLKSQGKGVGSVLAGAFASVISPVSLVTIGVVAASVAAIQYFSSIMSSSNAASEKLKEQAQLIQMLGEKWGDAVPALRDYANELTRAQDAADLKTGVSLINEKTLENVKKQIDDSRISIAALVSDLRAAGEEDDVIKRLQTAFKEFTTAADGGKLKTEEVKSVQDALAAAISSTGIPALDEFKKNFDAVATAALSAADNVGKVNDAASRMLPMSTWRSFNPSTGKLETNGQPWDENIQNPGFMTPEQGPVPGARPLRELDALPTDTASKKAETAAQKAANAYRDLVKSADDRIGQLQQEIELTGKFGSEADAARFKLDLLQASEDKGRSLSEAQRAELEKKVALYRQYSETLAKAKLSQDLLEERRIKSMSPNEQNVYKTLKEYGLPTDLNSNEANGIRKAIETNDLSDGIHSFFTDMSTALQQNGGDIGDALGDSIKNALMTSMNKQLENIFSQLAEGIASAVFGGKSGAGNVASQGGIAALGSSAASAVMTAPVGAVSRSALPDIGATTDIASYIAKAASARGIDPNVALRVAKSEGGLKSWNLQSQYVKNGVQEPSFGPFQLYKGGGLGNDFMKKTGMDPALASSGPAGVDFALDHAAKNGWGAWYGAKNTGIGNMEGIGVGGASTATEAVNNLAESAGAATKGLDTLGGGMGKLGQSLSSAFPSAPSAPTGGGGMGWLSSLFGGGGLSSAQIAKYTPMVGLFADGGDVTGPGSGTSDSIPTMLSNGEFVVKASQSKKHRALLHAINSGTLGRMAGGGLVSRSISAPVAPTLASRRSAANDNYQPGVLQVQIMGANGDEHVKALVQQGVSDGLGKYNKDQERGGFGTVQGQFSKRKG